MLEDYISNMNVSNLSLVDKNSIEKCIELDGLQLVIFKVDRIDPDKFYNNVIAFDVKDGGYLWTLEHFEDKRESSKNGQFRSLGPITNITSGGDFLIFFKTHGWKIPVDPDTGKIIKDLDLNLGGRPW